MCQGHNDVPRARRAPCNRRSKHYHMLLAGGLWAELAHKVRCRQHLCTSARAPARFFRPIWPEWPVDPGRYGGVRRCCRLESRSLDRSSAAGPAARFPQTRATRLVAGGELEGPGPEGSGALQDELVAHRQRRERRSADGIHHTPRRRLRRAHGVVHGTSMWRRVHSCQA